MRDPQSSNMTLTILNGTLGASVFGISSSLQFYPLASNLDYNAVQSYQVQVQVRSRTTCVCCLLFGVFSLC